MKKLVKLTLVAALALTFSCGEDYLEKVPSEFISTDQIADAASRNPDVIAGTMTGIYALQFDSGTGGTDNHDDYGQKGYDLYTDMLCGDVALTVSTYGWYRSDITEFQATQDFTRTRNYMPWRYYYRIIRSANTVIDALGGNDAVPELEANKYIMGQAKAIRGHSYFYLTQLFQKEYNPSEEILPIYDDLLDQNGPKVPASEIFTFIQNDLNDAITLLDGFSRSGKQEINQDVAKGILAYVYAAIGNDEGAQELTKQVIENGAFPIMSGSEVLGGFNDVSTPGWMWGVDLNSDTGVSLVSWWGQMDYYSYSYAAYGDYKACDADLFAAIPANDVRKGQFLDLPSNSRHLQPLYKFYEAQRQPFGSSQIIQSDYVYMRISEMYLLHCESAAKAGDEGRARTVLKLFLAERLDDTSYVDGLSGQALLDEIYLQTRIEFWGEGKTYLAMKRDKRSATRGPNHLSFVGETIQFNDERMTFEIPEAEILNNPFVSDQNL
jgi:hypothetical protein